jgi:hypothetical protein
MRIEARDDRLKMDGRVASAQFPATVYEPGVLFMRVTTFRRLLRTYTLDELGTRYLTFQIREDGLSFADIRMGFAFGDMLLYPDPDTAPERHPEERLAPEPDLAAEIEEAKGTLFDRSLW